LEYTISKSTGEQEVYEFYFAYTDTYSLLYKFSGPNGTVEGFDNMISVMGQLYLPSLKKDGGQGN
jgi:hypothetical protein